MDASDIAIAAQAGYTMKLLVRAPSGRHSPVGTRPLAKRAHPLSGVLASNAVYVEAVMRPNHAGGPGARN